MIEAQLRNPEVTVSRGQVFAAEGNASIDIAFPFGKAFQNGGEAVARTQLFIINPASARPQ